MLDPLKGKVTEYVKIWDSSSRAFGVMVFSWLTDDRRDIAITGDNLQLCKFC